MNILIIDLKSFGIEHIAQAFHTFGYEVNVKSFTLDNPRKSESFNQFFETLLAETSYDFVFTFNYFPVISNNCLKHSIKYVSWVYDSPHVSLFSCSIINPCNYIFIFDNEMYQELFSQGISTVYYLPLAASCQNKNTFLHSSIHQKFDCDVSFVGSLYNESHHLYSHFEKLSDYTKGYLDSLMQVQSHVYGYYFLEDMLTEPIIDELQKTIPYKIHSDGVESLPYIYSEYFMARRVTELERHRLLKAVSNRFNTKIYTGGDTSDFTNAICMGKVDYYNEMPYVFQCSKINLNITLKSIHTGIPLRAMDIMGAKGFLLTNYQEEMETYFTSGKDYVYYEDTNDLLSKIEYYLSHDDLRLEIAENSYQKVLKYHTFEERVKTILSTINVDSK